MITTIYLGEIKAVGTIFLILTGKEREIKQHLSLVETKPRNAQLFNTFKGSTMTYFHIILLLW